MPVTTNVYTGKDRGGQRVATYRDAQGQTYDVTILGPGSGSGLKVRLPYGTTAANGHQILDNVPIAVNETGTGVYVTRRAP